MKAAQKVISHISAFLLQSKDTVVSLRDERTSEICSSYQQFSLTEVFKLQNLNLNFACIQNEASRAWPEQSYANTQIVSIPFVTCRINEPYLLLLELL